MARRAKRASFALRLEILETRALLSADSANELFVRFIPGASPAAMQAALGAVGAQVVQTYPDGPELVDLNAGVNASDALKALEANHEVEYAEADGTIHESAYYPNDPYFSQLWGLNNSNNVDIDAPEAWSITPGNPNTVVAVLDTGIDLNNPDLVNNLWHNPSPGADGYAGDVFGWNFVNNNSNVQDVDGHGTHVSGILAAQGNNLYGVTGVDWNAKIMAVKVLDNSGNGTTAEAVSGIYYAVQHGARVINASWGGGPYSQAMHDAIAYADSRGVVFVTAAGNDSTNSDMVPSYPGSYNLPNEITVAAIDSSGNLASFSDYGAASVDLAAPGVNIVSTIPGGFATYSGTSMATPYVSGVVALLVGIHPEFNAEQLVQRVLATTKPLPSLTGLTRTGGMVDAFNAINFSGATSDSGTVSATVLSTLSVNNSSEEDALANVLSTNDVYNGFGGSDGSFVAGLYQKLAARSPGADELSWWVQQLLSGTSRAQLVFNFEHTTEALEVKVAHWYQDLLGLNESITQLKSNSGVDYWASLLASGQTDDQVRAEILSTSDVYNGFGGTNNAFVAGLYPALIGRGADPTSFSFFVGLLDSGMSRVSLVELMERTVEAKETTVARWYTELLGLALPVAQLKNDAGVSYWAAFLGNT